MWGVSTSPLIVDDFVIVQPGGRHESSIVAYNRSTGEPVWKSLDDPAAHTSPMLVTLAGKRQIVTVTAIRAVGLEVETGKLLWEFPWKTQQENNCAQPVIADVNHLMISAAWGHGSALLEISPAGDAFEAKAVWENSRMKNKFSTSVLYDGYFYGLDESILACMRVSDGQLMWKGGRYGYGQVLLAGGYLLVLTENGELVLVKATPEKWTQLAKFEAIEGKTWSSPAIDGGLLLVRNSDQMALFHIGQ
jgi:outer membrane protein assembly factor BamB